MLEGPNERQEKGGKAVVTPEFFRNTIEPVCIGPLVFLSTREKQDWSEIKYSGPGGLEEQPWLQNYLTRFGLSGTSNPRSLAFAVYEAYKDSYYDSDEDPVSSSEPEWFKYLDPATQAWLRRDRARYEAGYNKFILSSSYFNEVFGFFCVLDKEREGGVFKDLEEALWLSRLNNIRQLAWLTVPAQPGEPREEFPHNRYFHSCNVLAVASLIGKNLDLSDEDMKALQVAAFTHDVLTPAGGDRTKALDYKIFDEDLHYLEAFEIYPNRHTDSSVLMNNKSVLKRLPAREILVEAIKGRGVLGQILDIADKISYVGADAAMYIGGTIRFPSCLEDLDYQEIERMVDDAVRDRSQICAPWDDVKIKDGRVFFSSPDSLAKFLRLRALMFKNLYYNPNARSVEHVLASVTSRALYNNGVLSRDKLLNMDDLELERVMEKNLWEPDNDVEGGFSSIKLKNLHPRVTHCDSSEEAKMVFQSLQEENLVLMERFFDTTSTGEHLLTKVGEAIVPFSEARERETRELREIFRSRAGYVIYSVPFSELPLSEEKIGMLRAAQKTQQII